MKEEIVYHNEMVRRKDRLLSEEKAIELLRKGEYGILSMVEESNGEAGGYGIPFNYVWDEKKCIYFHCAPEGYKLECLKRENKVSFCVVGHTHVISNKFTAAYESIVVRGSASIVTSDEERMKALMLILDKYSPNDKEVGRKYAEKSFHRTFILKLNIAEVSGKRKIAVG